MQELLDFILATVANWGYLGIFIMMAIESTVLPLPSELVVIPAGYLAYKGGMSMAMILLTGTLGSIFGALINYYTARFLGRKFIIKYGKHIFIPPDKLQSVERFFHSHGSISTFSGRLIPVVRHLISIPAGLARMNLVKFIFYTGLGSVIWVTVLASLGYFIGQNEDMIKQYLHIITIAVIIFLLVLATIYIKLHKRSAKLTNK
jgi:membrane protein DedA with SNARE-associated domain